MKQKQFFTAGTKIGILGGGQLARMLCLAGKPLGLEIHILSEHKSDPAAQVTQFWHKGSPKKPKDLARFLKSVQLATFESEFLDAPLLADVARKEKCAIFPSPLIMEQIQDRWSQKSLLQKYKIPTSGFLKVDDLSELDEAYQKLGPLVLKTRRNGYDGYGTFVVKSLRDLKRTQKKLKRDPNGWIAEKWISFDKEVATIAIRGHDQKVVFLPLVETFQKDSRCYWVKGPLSNNLFSKVQTKVKKFLHEIDYVGAMGIEFFLKDDQLIVNELAPRVHNSGHYSQDALNESQFLGHLKAILGFPTIQPEALAHGFAMLNLLGQSHRTPKWSFEQKKGTTLHWYGKEKNRKGRKMGHLNTLADSPDKALKKILSCERFFHL